MKIKYKQMKTVIYILGVCYLNSCSLINEKDDDILTDQSLPISSERVLTCDMIKKMFVFNYDQNYIKQDSLIPIDQLINVIPSSIDDTLKIKTKFFCISTMPIDNSFDISVQCYQNNSKNKLVYNVFYRLDDQCNVLRLLLKSSDDKEKYLFVKNDSIEQAYIKMDRPIYKKGMKMPDGYSMEDYYKIKKKHFQLKLNNPKQSFEIWF